MQAFSALTNGSSGSMGFHKAYFGRCHFGTLQSCSVDAFLAYFAWSSKTGTRSVVVNCSTSDNCQYIVPISASVRKSLQSHNSTSFGSEIQDKKYRKLQVK
jgi:hypothetical protein